MCISLEQRPRRKSWRPNPPGGLVCRGQSLLLGLAACRGTEDRGKAFWCSQHPGLGILPAGGAGGAPELELGLGGLVLGGELAGGSEDAGAALLLPALGRRPGRPVRGRHPAALPPPPAPPCPGPAQRWGGGSGAAVVRGLGPERGGAGLGGGRPYLRPQAALGGGVSPS